MERDLAHPFAWTIERDGRLLGEARLDGFDPDDRRARLAVGLYGPRKLGKGLGREAIAVILLHAFGALKLRCVDLHKTSTNERAIRCYRACGFIVEGRRRECAHVDERRHDDVFMGVLPRDHANGAR